MYSFTLDFNPRYDFVRIPRVFFKCARYRNWRRIYSDGDNEHAKKRYRFVAQRNGIIVAMETNNSQSDTMKPGSPLTSQCGKSVISD